MKHRNRGGTVKYIKVKVGSSPKKVFDICICLRAYKNQKHKFIVHDKQMDRENVESRKREIAASKESSPWANWDFNWEGDNFKIADIHKLIIYQIPMATFFGEGSGYGENYRDVDKKLAYIKVLGINAMELVTEGFVPDAHRGMYDLENPLNTKEEKRGSKAFANLVKRAHLHGIAVIKAVDYLRFGFGDMNPWKL